MSGLTDHAGQPRRMGSVERRVRVAGTARLDERCALVGIWHVPEETLRVLPPLAGLRVLELGCGTAYRSAWLGRRGARPVGLDLSERQLANARRFQRELGPSFPLVHAT